MKELLHDKTFYRDIAIAILIALLICQFVRPTIVKGQSMEPTLQNNNYLFLYTKAYKDKLPDYEDIIVTHSILEDDRIIKRVIGLPGDTIKVEDNVVYRNGVALDEPYINEPGNIPGDCEVTVPNNEIFVMGDNRAHSTDSRYIGTIPMDDVIGKAVYRLFPFSEMGKL